MSARTGELSLPYRGRRLLVPAIPRSWTLDECLMTRSQLRSLNRVLYAMAILSRSQSMSESSNRETSPERTP
jgi:hypothetical protein